MEATEQNSVSTAVAVHREVLDISVEEADETLRQTFGTSGLAELANLSCEENR